MSRGFASYFMGVEFKTGDCTSEPEITIILKNVFGF